MNLEVATKPTRSVRQPDEVQQSLYAKREKVYPREVHGLFAAMRVSAVLVLLGLFYGLPWLRWNGQQLLLFDLPARQFHIFGLTIFPQDFVYLTLLLIMAALSLFFFTAIGGRLWCGYACPQTVWTEVFMWIDRKIEGDRPKQMKLDKASWSVPINFLSRALSTSYGFYFQRSRDLPSSVTSPPSWSLDKSCSPLTLALGRPSGSFSTAWQLTAMRAGCGNRCAFTCVPMPAFRARCSIGTHSSSPMIVSVANRAGRANARWITVPPVLAIA